MCVRFSLSVSRFSSGLGNEDHHFALRQMCNKNREGVAFNIYVGILLEKMGFQWENYLSVISGNDCRELTVKQIYCLSYKASVLKGAI